MLTGGC